MKTHLRRAAIIAGALCLAGLPPASAAEIRRASCRERV